MSYLQKTQKSKAPTQPLRTTGAQAGQRAVEQFLNLQEKAIDSSKSQSAEDLARSWEEAFSSGDYSAINQKLAGALKKANKTGGYPEIQKLQKQLNQLIHEKRVGPVFTKAESGYLIQNVRQFPDEQIENLEKMDLNLRNSLGIAKIEGFGWVQKIGPEKTVDIEKEDLNKAISFQSGCSRQISLHEQSQIFRAEDDSMIIYPMSPPALIPDEPGDLIYSPDGKTFRDVFPLDFNNEDNVFGSLQHSGAFIDPVIDANKEFAMARDDKGDTVTVEGKIFRRIKGPESIESSKLPEVREAKRMFSLPDGRLIYASCNKYLYNEHNNPIKEDFFENLTKPALDEKMYLGEPGNMHEIKIHKVFLDLDGGGHIITSEGMIKMPAQIFGIEGTYHWAPVGGTTVNLQLADPDEYIIVENQAGLNLVAKE